METLLLESAVRAILIAAGTGLVLSVMRIKHVVARHHAWTAVMLFMLMVPLWTAFGYQVPIRVLSPIGQQSERIRPISAETNPIVSDFSSAVPERYLKLRPLDWRRLVLGVLFLGRIRSAASVGNGYYRRLFIDPSGPTRTGTAYQFVMCKPNHRRMGACGHDPAGWMDRMVATKARCCVGARRRALPPERSFLAMAGSSQPCGVLVSSPCLVAGA